MKRIIFTLSLAAVAACSSVPDKKILKDKDYQLWQKDLAARVSRESHDLNLVAQLTEIALINEDFDTALASNRTLQQKSFGDMNRLKLQEIEILRYQWKLDEALQKLHAFVAANPKDAASAILTKRRPVIEKSKALPAPLKVSPYAANPYKEFSYAQMMQASEVSYLDGPEKEIFARTENNYVISQDVWLKSLKTSPQIIGEIGDDAEVLHFPAMPANDVNPIEAPPFVQRKAGNLTLYHADQRAEGLDFLTSRGCTLPAFSPWMDFIIASCKNKSDADLILFTRTAKGWQESPINKEVNSEFDEVAPRISADGRYLFFSSDGHPGYGAFDYYFAAIEYPTPCAEVCVRIGRPVNFGPQVNTFHNEVYPLQLSPYAKGIVFSAEGRDGLVGKIAGNAGHPKVAETTSVRFIAYDGQKTPDWPITLQPLKGDSRPATTIVSGRRSDWIRLIAGAEYKVAFKTQSGTPLAYHMKARTDKEANFIVERFSVISVPETIKLTYDEDATKVTTQIRPEIEKAAEQLRANPELHAVIEGHADNIGGEGYNQGLSEKRADAAKKQLVSIGIPARRITTRGWGQYRPLNSNSTKEERAANRRIEILIVPD